MDSEQTFTELVIPTAWGQISGKTWGDKNGMPVVGIHGWTDNAGTFDRLAPLLPKSFYFVVVDLPGHGFSSHHPQGIMPSFTDNILLLKRVLTTYFKWTKFSIIGHSMGAWGGILYASLFPNEVVHLVSLDVIKPIERECGGMMESMSASITLALEQELRDFSTKSKLFSYKEALRLQRRFYGDTLTEDSAKIIMKRGCREVNPNEYCFTRDVRFLNPGLAISQFWCRGDTLDVMRRLKCRFLILKGKEGTFVEPDEINNEALEIYRKNCAYFEYHLMEGNHYFHLNHPEEAAKLISEFFLKSKSLL